MSIPSAPSNNSNATTFPVEAPSPSSDPSASDHKSAAAGRRPNNNEKKRKANGAAATSSRGVANLTPEQLAKKRANDREAQRAIRERTKNQIETLERRIQELTSQQPYQELQHALRQKELVEAENAEIKRRLFTVLELIKPVVGNSASGDTLRSVTQNDEAQSAPLVSSQYPQDVSQSQYSRSDLNNANLTNGQAWPGALAHTQNSIQPTGRFAARGDPLSSSVERKSRGDSVTQDNLVSMIRTTSAEREALGLLTGGGRPEMARTIANASSSSSPLMPHADARTTIHQRSPAQPPQQSAPKPYEPSLPSPTPRPPFATLPRDSGPSCTLDNLLLEFASERRARLSEGSPSSEVLGPLYPSFGAILYPSSRIHRPCHPMSAFFRDILATFPDISAPPEKVAVSLVMFLIMRWHVHPTVENYERLPVWCRPTSWQVTMPHPVWIDHLPWPEMRSEIIKDQQRYPFDGFFVPYTGTLSLNWPYQDNEVFARGEEAATGEDVDVGAPGGEEDLYMSRAFERHLLRLDNWSLGPAFAHEHPMLVASVRMEDRKGGKG